MAADVRKRWIVSAWRWFYDQAGSFGILTLGVLIIPATALCLANRRWSMALVPPIFGWMMIRVYRGEDRKKEQAAARRAQVRAMLDDFLAAQRPSYELTRDQLEQLREWI